MSKGNAIVVGAGIAGLAMAKALAGRGYAVTVLERNHRAIGASIRNFGMVWPVGQPSGELYDAAMRSAVIWKEMCSGAGIFHDPVGSMHLAYHPDEALVLEELYSNYKTERPFQLLKADEVLQRSPAVVADGLISGLFSTSEIIVDPREAIWAFPEYLSSRYPISFKWGESVTDVGTHSVRTASEKYDADLVVICSGMEFETLYPEIFARESAVKCKLQMMRFGPQPENWRIGPALCGGLSLIHYHSFKAAGSLPALKARYEAEMGEYLDWGIHVMVSQNGKGELTIGDSHEYGGTHDPFDKGFINEMILKYLRTFARFRNEELLESWNGIYTKLMNGKPYFFHSPNKDVYVLNGVGGNGMTLSFGLAEKLAVSIS
jgi:FAD dependent oxidoreductase TIGR03364